MKLRTRRYILIVLALTAARPALASLTSDIDAVLRRSSVSRVQFSIRVVNPATGRELYARNARTPLIPASNMKLIASAAALHYLGPTYEYCTVVARSGPDLVVIGGGDPLLADEKTDRARGREPLWILKDIHGVLKANGIKTVRNIIIDTAFFDQQRVHPSWPAKDLNRWFACELSGLNFNDNCITATAINRSGRVSIIIQPETDFVRFTNKVQPTTSRDDAFGSYRTAEPNRLVFFGTCRDRQGPADIAIEQPALYFATCLAEHLRKNGIPVTGSLTESPNGFQGDLEPLTIYKTPIADCLKRCNKNSLGLVAEALVKTIAAENAPGRRYGSWTFGNEHIGRYLVGLGIDPAEFKLDDGSGLSRENRLTANAVSVVLLDMYRGNNWPMFGDSLATGGEDGTIGGYFTQERYRGRILAKTGYVSGVNALSGVCKTDSGDIVFSILANNSAGRGPLNDIAKAIVDNH
ncbi:MAG TPA: D-alanyl-D-alanine carboxypeptidase/D-alanyl-D-alanine-endopeptidase [Phycisphaerales bacterium]|nr:D-alanyl-D-alanine carboxypeptidase/D-alanyl-D-alanine-endopeptidase [Phycisphaerales bacterium]